MTGQGRKGKFGYGLSDGEFSRRAGPGLSPPKHFSTRLARAEGGTVLAGGHAGVEFEGRREMALAGEACEQGDLGERRVGRGKCAAGGLDPEPADVVSDRAAVMLTEGAG